MVFLRLFYYLKLRGRQCVNFITMPTGSRHIAIMRMNLVDSTTGK